MAKTHRGLKDAEDALSHANGVVSRAVALLADE
jgi:hypothetical protein